MNIFAPFAKISANKSLSTPQESAPLGAVAPFYGTTALNFFGKGSYDNNYANINRIADSISTVIPFAVDVNGEKIEDAPQALLALLQPNRRMSVTKFLKALSVLALVYPYVPILIWHYEGGKLVPGGKNATADNIAGFTFLEGVQLRQVDGVVEYIETATGKVFGDNDVMRISFDVSPYGVTDGYSASLASKKWATLEDCLADYQVGHFKNGAKPGGIFVVSAPTTDDFNNAVDELEKKMRGAGNNNRTIYAHRHLDMITGQSGTTEVEWVPISSSNNELALKEIFDQAERARDMAFGVPAELKGYLQNSNYSSVMMAERIYDKYVILPKLTQLWSDFTHELNRITGGLGFAFDFDYDVQAIAEDEKTIVERKALEYDLYKEALRDGCEPDTICESLNLPKELADLELKTAEQSAEGEPTQGDEKTEQNAAKRANLGANVRFLGKSLTAEEQKTLDELEVAFREALEKDVENYADDTEEARKARREKLLAVLTAIAVARMESAGSAEYAVAVAMAVRAGIPLKGNYTLSEEAQAEYEKELGKVVESYSQDNYDAIEKAKSQAQTTGEDVAVVVGALVATEAWRAKRAANSEEHRAFETAQIDAFETAQEQIQQIEGLGAAQYYKTWNCMAGACSVCAGLDGMRIPLEDSFPDVDDWGEDIAYAHPNCRCYLTFDIDDIEKSVKVDCPECGLFLTEGTHAHLEKMKCNRCKKWFSVEIKGGSSTAKEVTK